MHSSDDSAVLSLVKVQIDSSRDTMAFFQRVHRLNRMDIEHFHLPHLVVQAGTWILVAVALRILWVFLRPRIGPYLGRPPTLGAGGLPKKAPSGASAATSRGSRKIHSGGGTSLPASPRVDRSGLKVTKRPKPAKDPGPSLPRW